MLKTGNKKIIKKLILLVITIIAAFFLTIYANILYYSHFSTPEKSDVIIVLGCHIYKKSPSLSLEYRLKKALDLYKSGYASSIIVSGGQGDNEIVSEASVMKSWLVNNGVSSNAIIEENKSSSTYENIRFSKEYMDKSSFKSAIIVSNDFHIFRSLRIAKKFGIHASGAPAQTVWYLKLYYQAREILSVIKGLILNRL
ncbi:MAG: YdcF family protein [Clostridia bacterium]|nr:YdcF family protein [Clostridia bacterium]